MATTPLVGYKVAYFHSVQEELLFGWSENFWCEAAGLGAALAIAETIRPFSMAIHGHQTVLRAIRVTDIGPPRVTRVTHYSGSVNPATPSTSPSDYQTSAGGLILRSGDIYQVSQWIRGIWDDAVSVGGVWTPSSTYVPLVNAFLAQLSAPSNLLRLRVTNKTNAAVPVTALTQLGLVTATVPGLVSGNRVRISGTKGVPGLNKTWTVQVNDANSFFITPWIIPATAPVFTQLGTVRLLSPTLVPVTYASIIRATKRDVGRPFGLLSGRRSNRTT